MLLVNQAQVQVSGDGVLYDIPIEAATKTVRDLLLVTGGHTLFRLLLPIIYN